MIHGCKIAPRAALMWDDEKRAQEDNLSLRRVPTHVLRTNPTSKNIKKVSPCSVTQQQQQYKFGVVMCYEYTQNIKIL